MSATDLFRATGARRILVGLSGGKDSLVVLDLAAAHFGPENVEAFFMRLVDGLRCELDPVERAVRRTGVVLHSVPHWLLSECIRKSTLMPAMPGAADLRPLKQRDIEDALRARTGIDWVAYGHREAEGVVRMAMLRKCQGIEPKHRRLYPIWKWKTPAVYSYLRSQSIPIPPPLAVKRAGQSGGIDLTPFGLTWLLEHHPEDFARLEKVFPYARASVHKHRASQKTDSLARAAGGAKCGTASANSRPVTTGPGDTGTSSP